MREHLSGLDLTRQASVCQNRCAMRLQRRLSTAFVATGHPALRPNPPARICQLPGPLGTIASITWLAMKTMADAMLDIIDENNQVLDERGYLWISENDLWTCFASEGE
jgi:hypothetical protein